MDKFEKRRRALTEGLDNKFWVYKEGDTAWRHGITAQILIPGKFLYKDSYFRIHATKDDNNSRSNEICFSAIDFSKFKKLCFDCKSDDDSYSPLTYVGYHKSPTLTCSTYDVYKKYNPTRAVYEFDISAVTGNKYIHVRTQGGKIGYFYNIWLE